MATKTKTIKTDPFTLSTPAGRDIWRKPPAHDVFDAPFHPNPLPTYPLKAFQKARISFELPAIDKLRKFDQGKPQPSPFEGLIQIRIPFPSIFAQPVDDGVCTCNAGC